MFGRRNLSNDFADWNIGLLESNIIQQLIKKNDKNTNLLELGHMHYTDSLDCFESSYPINLVACNQ
jgi:hypothetical protein